MNDTELTSCLAVAHGLADAARPLAMQYFRSDSLAVDNKNHQAYDPVTLADRSIETEMRRILAETRPDDGISGEEFPPHESRNGLTWVLDPIDGTRPFLCGLPSWGVLIALNNGTQPVLGVMDQPFTRERFVGIDMPSLSSSATLISHNTERPLSTRSTTTLDTALMCSTAPDMFTTPHEQKCSGALSNRVRMTRYGTDCYGYAMLAAGQVDLVLEASLKPYDIQALMPLIRAAGGIVTDWQGGDCQQGGQVIAAATKTLHEEALSVLNTA